MARKTISYGFTHEADEPSVSYAIIGEAAHWDADVAEHEPGDFAFGSYTVYLTRGAHRLVIDADNLAGRIMAFYLKDGLLVREIRTHEELLELIILGPVGDPWQANR